MSLNHPSDPSNVSTGDEDLVRNSKVVFILRICLVTAAFGFSFIRILNADLLSEQVYFWPFVLIGIAYGLGLAGALALKRTGYLRLFTFAQILGDAVLVSILVIMTNGGESVFVFAYAFVAVEAGLLHLKFGAVAGSLACALMFVAVQVIQLYGYFPRLLPQISLESAVVSFFVHTTGIGLAAYLAGTLGQKLRMAGKKLAEKEQALEKLSELQVAILKALPAGLLTVDSSGRIVYANESAHQLIGCMPQQLIGSTLEEYLPQVAGILKGLDPSVSDSFKKHRYETAVRKSNGQSIRLGYSLSPLYASGSPQIIMVFQDVTEVVKLEEAVKRSEKLATVGRFAAGLAHEVRNPLASMCAGVQVLERNVQATGSTHKLMRNILREAERLNSLITDFLSLAAPREAKLQRMDLASVVDDVVQIFAYEASTKGIKVHCHVKGPLYVFMDADLIRQFLWNVLRNAEEALESADEGIMKIDVLPNDKDISLRICDNGPGLDTDKIQLIFDPFYTTKKGGSGLGLAICDSIARAHNASFDFDSRLGQGTSVTLTLAAVE